MKSSKLHIYLLSCPIGCIHNKRRLKRIQLCGVGVAVGVALKGSCTGLTRSLAKAFHKRPYSRTATYHS